jgi:hypothetical protein
MPSQPTLATVKALFAKSGNQCAFPKCYTPLVEPSSGKVTGRLCHIRGKSRLGPRYDSSLTDLERHGEGNLILLCPIHHDVVDADLDSYTVARLFQIKSQHEAGATVAGTLCSEHAKRFLLTVAAPNTVTDGSIIYSQGQMGGQIAHQITNVGTRPREISQEAAALLIAQLRHRPAETIRIVALLGDSESYRLAEIIKAILTEAGWEVDGVNGSWFAGLPRGIIVKTPIKTETAHILLHWLEQTGLRPIGNLEDKLTRMEVVVGANL